MGRATSVQINLIVDAHTGALVDLGPLVKARAAALAVMSTDALDRIFGRQ